MLSTKKPTKKALKLSFFLFFLVAILVESLFSFFSLSWSKACFLVFLLFCFLFMNFHLRYGHFSVFILQILYLSVWECKSWVCPAVGIENATVNSLQRKMLKIPMMQSLPKIVVIATVHSLKKVLNTTMQSLQKKVEHTTVRPLNENSWKYHLVLPTNKK